MAVVIFHYHHFYLASDLDRPNLPASSEFPYAAILNPVFVHGSHAVELFWIISGFVFAHVYLKRDSGFFEFALARFARLYPLHAATLLLVALLQLASIRLTGHWQIYGNNDARHFLLQLGFASNWSVFSRGLSFNGPIWSVSQEILIYLVFFLALRPLRMSGTATAALAAAGFWILHLNWPADMPVIAQGVERCGAYFFLGVFFNIVAARFMSRPGGALLLGVACAATACAGLVLGLGDLAVSGIAGGLVLASLAMDRSTLGHGRWLTSLGQASYSLYLVHVPIQMALLLTADTVFGGTRAFADSYLTLPLYAATSLAVAIFTYRRFERPAGAWLRRLGAAAIPARRQ